MATSTDQRTFSAPHAVILIPAYNECEMITKVIADIRQHCDLPVIVIDDASTDGTATSAQAAGVTVISLPAQLGAWGATQTGLRYALRHGYEVAISMDADGQHKAESLEDLISPVAQGVADVQRHHAQSVQQILAEGSLGDRRVEVSMRRRDDPHVDGLVALRPHRPHLRVLEHAQQLGLQLGGHVSDLVEEEGSARRLAEAAAARLDGARERPALVPEELALEQVARNRGGVDGHEAKAFF